MRQSEHASDSHIRQPVELEPPTHAGGCVDSVSKEAISWVQVSHNGCHHGARVHASSDHKEAPAGILEIDSDALSSCHSLDGETCHPGGVVGLPICKAADAHAEAETKGLKGTNR